VKTLVIDGHNALWRIQKSLPELRTPKGVPVQVVYGVLRLVRSVVELFEPDRVLICWDQGSSKFRREIYPDYKRKRRVKREAMSKEDRKAYEDTFRQLKVLRKLMPHLGIMQASIQDVEADDIIGVACKFMSGQKIVVSADRDMLQLVNEDVSVWSPSAKELYNHKNFKKKVKLTPRQWLELRAFTGDTSDNIPGAVKGFGEKSALTLLQKYGSIEKIRSRLGKIVRQGGRYNLLIARSTWSNVERNLQLMDLRRVHGRKRINKRLRKSIGSEPRLNSGYLQRYFMKRAFSSLLKEFSYWIVPFRRMEKVK
jgi:DNA polymerase-1